mgnify:CR=1 FL=1
MLSEKADLPVWRAAIIDNSGQMQYDSGKSETHAFCSLILRWLRSGGTRFVGCIPHTAGGVSFGPNPSANFGKERGKNVSLAHKLLALAGSFLFVLPLGSLELRQAVGVSAVRKGGMRP